MEIERKALLKRITLWATSFVAIVAAIKLAIAMGGAVQLDSEAKEWREDHVLTEAQIRLNERVDRIEIRSQQIEYNLLDAALPLEKRDFLKRQIEKNDNKIVCIQDKKC